MTTSGVLERLASLGVTVKVSGEKLLLEPGSKVPADLMAQVKEHKPAILETLSRRPPLGDGQRPPLDRPPKTEAELRRLMDHWDADPAAWDRYVELVKDPAAFSRWLGRDEARRLKKGMGNNGADGRLLEPGWPGSLAPEELAFIKASLRANRQLRTTWGFIRGTGRISDEAIKDVAYYGVPARGYCNVRPVKQARAAVPQATNTD